MPRKLSPEEEQSIRMGLRPNCDNCGHSLKIVETPNDNGSKSLNYRCINDACQQISGAILIPWYESILNNLKKSTVAIALIAIVTLTGFLTNFISNQFSPQQTSSIDWSRLRAQLEEKGCEFREELESKQEFILNCLSSLETQLKEAQKIDAYAEKLGSRFLVFHFLRGKSEALVPSSSTSSFSQLNKKLKDDVYEKGKEFGLVERNRLIAFFPAEVQDLQDAPSINSDLRSMGND